MNFRILAIRIAKKLHLADSIKKFLSRSHRQVLSTDGTADLPLSVGFELTTKCNLNCVMCYQKEERLLGKRDLSFEEIRKVINNLGSIKQASLIGAEIFTRPDIFQIIEEFIKRGIKLYLTSNGTLINEEVAEKLKKYKKGIRGIGFSLDGSKETHNKIRGLDSAFDRTIKAINLLKNDFNISVNSVMMESNLDELYDLVQYLSNMGVVNFGLTMEMFATAEEVAASKKILGEENPALATSISSQPGYKFSFNKLKETISKIRKIKGINVVIHPDIFDVFPEEAYSGDLRGKTKLVCKNIFVGRVNAQGDVIFCPFIKKPFGNLLNETMEQIWNKEEFKSFRNKLVKNNLLPICKRCCKLGLSADKNEEQIV